LPNTSRPLRGRHRERERQRGLHRPVSHSSLMHALMAWSTIALGHKTVCVHRGLRATLGRLKRITTEKQPPDGGQICRLLQMMDLTGKKRPLKKWAEGSLCNESASILFELLSLRVATQTRAGKCSNGMATAERGGPRAAAAASPTTWSMSRPHLKLCQHIPFAAPVLLNSAYLQRCPPLLPS
jgi:hypothetical protein